MKNNFDFLRFTFAFIVVLAHILDLSESTELSFLRPFFDSYISVTCFFVISGYLISKSYINSLSLKDYFIKRAKRLLPAYIFVVLACALFFSLVSNLSYSSYFLNSELIKYVVSNLAFLNFIQPELPGVFVNNHISAVNGALWTIKVEVCFYILLPILIIWSDKIDKKYVFFTIIYVLSLIYKFATTGYYNSTGSSIFDILSHQLPAYMTYFICGVALNYYSDLINKHIKSLLLPAIIIFGMEYYFKIEVLMPVATSLIIYYLAFNGKFLNNFGRYGDISYGIYIYHFPIIQLFVHFHFFQKYNPWVMSGAIIILVISVSYISWHYLEKRFLTSRRTHANKGPLFNTLTKPVLANVL